MLKFILLGVFAVLALISYFRLTLKDFLLGINSTAILYILRGFIRPSLITKNKYVIEYLNSEGILISLLWGILYYSTLILNSFFSSINTYELWEAITVKAIVGAIIYGILFCGIYIIVTDSPFNTIDLFVSVIGFFIWYIISFSLTEIMV